MTEMVTRESIQNRLMGLGTESDVERAARVLADMCRYFGVTEKEGKENFSSDKVLGIFVQWTKQYHVPFPAILDAWRTEWSLTEEQLRNVFVAVPASFAVPFEHVRQNINTVVDRFKGEGLTAVDYVQAACKAPSLFYQRPETIEQNIRGVVDRFKGEGLTAADYVKAACKQPPLFCLRPETIEPHARIIIDTRVGFGLDRDPSESWASICSNPMMLCKSEKNLTQSQMYAFMLDYYQKKILRTLFSIGKEPRLKGMAKLLSVAVVMLKEEATSELTREQSGKKITSAAVTDRATDIAIRIFNDRTAQKS